MGIVWIEHLVFMFPELLLLVIVATLLLGRYYRLSAARIAALPGARET